MITDEADNVGAFGPLVTSVEVSGKVGILGVGLGGSLDGPLWVDDGSHQLFDFFVGSSFELRLNLGLPGCVCAVYKLSGFFQADWVLSMEKLEDVLGSAET